MVKRVEHLSLNRIEVGKLAAVKFLELGLAKSLDRNGPERQEAGVWVVFIWHNYVGQLDVMEETQPVPPI